jgi:hypothetical protein
VLAGINKKGWGGGGRWRERRRKGRNERKKKEKCFYAFSFHSPSHLCLCGTCFYAFDFVFFKKTKMKKKTWHVPHRQRWGGE